MTDLEKDLYPEFTQEDNEKIKSLISGVMGIIKKKIDEEVSELLWEIEESFIDDARWHFARHAKQKIINALTDYTNARGIYHYDYKKIRKKILNENREEIINDLNNDYLEEIKSLKKQLDFARKMSRY